MTSETSSANPNPTASQAPVFQLQRVYLKDASLEMPHAPQIFLEQGSPQIEVQLDVNHDNVVEGVVEVDLGHGCAGDRGQQRPAQRVAQRVAEARLEGPDGESLPVVVLFVDRFDRGSLDDEHGG